MFSGDDSRTQEAMARLAVLLAALLWGTTGTAASFSSQLSPLAIGAFAMGVGGLLQALRARRQIRRDLARLLAMKGLLWLGVLAIAIYPLAFYSAMHLAGVAIGTVIAIASAPFFALLIESFFGHQPPISRRWLVSMVLGVAGVMLLMEPGELGHAPLQQQGPRLAGMLLGLLAGLTYALYSWVARRLMDRGVQSASAMGSLFGLGALLLIPSLLITGEHLFSGVNNLLVIGYMALVPMFIGYLAYGFGLRHVNASKATLLTLFEPVVAALLAVSVVGERLSLAGCLGMGLIMACLLLQAREPGA